jgi:hypothetical protein
MLRMTNKIKQGKYRENLEQKKNMRKLSTHYRLIADNGLSEYSYCLCKMELPGAESAKKGKRRVGLGLTGWLTKAVGLMKYQTKMLDLPAVSILIGAEPLCVVLNNQWHQ